jgi:hypothetical protein
MRFSARSNTDLSSYLESWMVFKTWQGANIRPVSLSLHAHLVWPFSPHLEYVICEKSHWLPGYHWPPCWCGGSRCQLASGNPELQLASFWFSTKLFLCDAKAVVRLTWMGRLRSLFTTNARSNELCELDSLWQRNMFFFSSSVWPSRNLIMMFTGEGTKSVATL